MQYKHLVVLQLNILLCLKNHLKRILLFLPICLFLFNLALAQNREAWNNSIKVAITYEEKVRIALNAGDFYLDADKPTLAKYFYEIAVTTGNNYLQGSLLLADALFKLANIQVNQDLARTLYEQALAIYQKQLDKNDLQIAYVLEALVLTYDYEGAEFELAVENLERAVAIRKRYKDDVQNLTETLRVLGWLYELKMDFNKAEKYYLQAFKEDTKDLAEDDIRLTLAMERMAQFYLDIEAYKKAEKFLWKKIRMHKRQKYVDLYNLGRSQSMIGWTYLQLKYMKDAEEQYLNALESINKSMDYKYAIPTTVSLQALLDLVYFYASQEKFDQAKPYFDMAQKILDTDGDGSLSDYAQSLENELLSGEVSYPWSAHAQIIGIHLMIEYALKNN